MRDHGGGDVPLDTDVVRGDSVVGCHHKYLGISAEERRMLHPRTETRRIIRISCPNVWNVNKKERKKERNMIGVLVSSAIGGEELKDLGRLRCWCHSLCNWHSHLRVPSNRFWVCDLFRFLRTHQILANLTIFHVLTCDFSKISIMFVGSNITLKTDMIETDMFAYPKQARCRSVEGWCLWWAKLAA